VASQNPLTLLINGLNPRSNHRRAPNGQPMARNSASAAPSSAPANSAPVPSAQATGPAAARAAYGSDLVVDLERRRDQLTGRVAELQWDLGGLVYEMAIRNRIRVDVLVSRAAALQDADAELSEVERIVRMEQTGTAGICSSCGAPHSSGATFCWQCGTSLLQQVSGEAILKG
jgi:ribosomal protein L40E